MIVIIASELLLAIATTACFLLYANPFTTVITIAKTYSTTWSRTIVVLAIILQCFCTCGSTH